MLGGGNKICFHEFEKWINAAVSQQSNCHVDNVTYIHIFKTGVSKRVCKLRFPPLLCCVTKQQR